jgi:hypothetical protein
MAQNVCIVAKSHFRAGLVAGKSLTRMVIVVENSFTVV